MRSLAMSIFLYACESWTQAMAMRCLRKLLGITYRDHLSNEEGRNRTRQAIGPHEDLLTTVMRRKLKWYGHVTRSTGLAKTILQGTVQGGRSIKGMSTGVHNVTLSAVGDFRRALTGVQFAVGGF